MGTGFLTQAFLSVDDRGAFRALISQTETFQKQVGRFIQRAMTLNPAYQQELGGLVKTATELLNESNHLARTEVLEIDLLQYPASDYFNQLTQTIDAINAVRISGADRLAQVLDANADKQRNVLIRCAANPAVQGRVKSADGKAVLVDWIGFNAASAAVRCTGE